MSTAATQVPSGKEGNTGDGLRRMAESRVVIGIARTLGDTHQPLSRPKQAIGRLVALSTTRHFSGTVQEHANAQELQP